MGITHLSWLKSILAPLARPASRRFAEQILTFDHKVGVNGLQAGSQWLTKQFVSEVWSSRVDQIPKSGPVLFTSNHPGMADTVSLFATIPRPDLKILAAMRPFLLSLPNVTHHLIYISEDTNDRMRVIRETVTYLKQGGAVLTFPAGKIEPDPQVMPGAIASLDGWGESIAMFARLVPQTYFVPTIVAGVISKHALQNPLTRLRRTQINRERMAAGLQVMFKRYHHVKVHVNFGNPMLSADLVKQYTTPIEITRAITSAVKMLIQDPPPPVECIIE